MRIVKFRKDLGFANNTKAIRLHSAFSFTKHYVDVCYKWGLKEVVKRTQQT